MNQNVLAAIFPVILAVPFLPIDALGAPPGPVDIRFRTIDRQLVETEIGISWNRQSVATGYRVFRMLQQVVAPAAALPSPDEGATSAGVWRKIAEVHNPEYTFVDRDIPPPTRRSLGLPHCYKVQAFNQEGLSASPMICKRKRGLNRPTIKPMVVLSASSVRVSWIDNSSLESGFKIAYRKPGSQTRRIIEQAHPGDGFVVARNLSPNTEYCFQIWAYDFYGPSDFSYPSPDCVKTLPDQGGGGGGGGTPPEDQPASAIIGIKMDVTSGDAGSCNGSWRYRFEPQNLTGSVGQSTTQEFDRTFDGLTPLQVGPQLWECRFITTFVNFRAGSWKVTVGSPIWNTNCTTTLVGGVGTTSNFSGGFPSCTHTIGQFP
jgi:hypothetical protein